MVLDEDEEDEEENEDGQGESDETKTRLVQLVFSSSWISCHHVCWTRKIVLFHTMQLMWIVWVHFINLENEFYFKTGFSHWLNKRQ